MKLFKYTVKFQILNQYVERYIQDTVESSWAQLI